MMMMYMLIGKVMMELLLNNHYGMMKCKGEWVKKAHRNDEKLFVCKYLHIIISEHPKDSPLNSIG